MAQSVPSIWVYMQSWFTPTVLFVLVNIVIVIIAFFPSRNTTPNRLSRRLSRTSSILEGLKSFNLYRHSTQEAIPPIEAVDYIPDASDAHGSLPRQLSRTSSWFENLRSFSIYHQSTQEATVDHPPPAADDHGGLPRQLSRTSSLYESLRTFSNYRQNTQETVPAVDQHPPPADEPETAQSQSKLPRQLSRTSSIFESLRSFNLYRQNAHQEAPPVVTAVEQEAFETVETVDHGDFRKSQSEIHAVAEEMQERVGLKKMKKSASTKPNVERLEEETVGVRRPMTMREGKAAKEEDEVDVRADDFINRFRQQLKLQRLDSLLRYKDMLNRGK